MSLRHVLHAGAFALFASTKTALAGVFYDCDLDTKIPNGWVSSKVGLIFDDVGKVTVIDRVILAVVGKPIRARARARGEVVRVSWTISGAKDSLGQYIPKFSYLAILDRASMTLSVVAKPVGAPQRFSAKGTCQIRNEIPKSLR